MRVSITYIYKNDEQTRIQYSDDVFVDDNMTDTQIKEWYEHVHRYLHHDGIEVMCIRPYSNF